MPRIETLAARAGSAPDPASGALAPPLQLATTFQHTPDAQLPHGFLYQRYDNPTQRETEAALATLDGAARTLLFPTGMAAASVALQSLPAGSHVLLCDDSYFSIRVIARDWLPRWGMSATVVDFTDLDAVRAALRPDTRLLWAETPSNPLLKVSPGLWIWTLIIFLLLYLVLRKWGFGKMIEKLDARDEAIRGAIDDALAGGCAPAA